MKGMLVFLVLFSSAALYAAPNDDLIEAARAGDAAKIKSAVSAGAKVNYELPGPGVTALFLAASGGHAEAVKALIGLKANVNARERMDGRTALIVASYEGHFEVVELLVKAGADIKAKDNNDHTALGQAEFNVQNTEGDQAERIRKVIAMLKKAGAK